MTAYNLCPASEPDQGLIFESYRITVGPYIVQTWGWDECFQKENFWKHHPIQEFKIIQVENSFGGGLHIEEDETDLWIRMIFLLPARQGLGIGSRLLTAIHDLAHAKRKGVSLRVVRCNPAKRLYDRLGFIVTGHDASSYDMRWA